MEYSEELASRVRRALSTRETVESPLLGGNSFWVEERLVISIHGDDLLVRVPSDDYLELLDRPGARPYEFAARPVPAWVVVEAEALGGDETLAEWVNIGLDGPNPG